MIAIRKIIWLAKQAKTDHILVSGHGEHSVRPFSVFFVGRRRGTGLRVAGWQMAQLREIYLQIMG
jgi:hypothetical protein